MGPYTSSVHSNCLSLADGFHGKCEMVYAHNNNIGASEEDVVIIPDELACEFEKLSTTIHSLGRAFELGIIHE